MASVVVKNTSSIIWMGDIEANMDEEYIKSAFAAAGYKALEVKEMKKHGSADRATFCFVDFGDVDTATEVLNNLQNEPIPEAEGDLRFNLNKSDYGTRSKIGGTKEYSLFVGDITKEVTDVELLEFFQRSYESVRAAKIVVDAKGKKKSYGFVRFFDEEEYKQALEEMAGAVGLGQRPIRVSKGTKKDKKKKGEDGKTTGATDAQAGDKKNSTTAAATTATTTAVPQLPPPADMQEMFAQYPGMAALWQMMQLMQNPRMQAFVLHMHTCMQQFEYNLLTQQAPPPNAQAQNWRAAAEAWKIEQQQLLEKKENAAAGIPMDEAPAVSATAADVDLSVNPLLTPGMNPMQAYMLNKPFHMETEDDDALVEHTMEVDVASLNQALVERDEMLFLEVEESRWSGEHYTARLTEHRPRATAIKTS